ncbi:MAG: hypothetical protein WCG92_25415, partial [Hyphomicrobiales bacterium]
EVVPGSDHVDGDVDVAADAAAERVDSTPRAAVVAAAAPETARKVRRVGEDGTATMIVLLGRQALWP